jgi:hypothetical protein
MAAAFSRAIRIEVTGSIYIDSLFAFTYFISTNLLIKSGGGTRPDETTATGPYLGVRC